MNYELKNKVLSTTEKEIKDIIDNGITPTNLDNLFKLVDIHKDVVCEKGETMYREDYGHDYGRRDYKYRGYNHLDRMYDDYGRYMDYKSRYGASEDTKKSLEYMLKSMEEFAHMLREEASSQDEIQMIRDSARRILNNV